MNFPVFSVSFCGSRGPLGKELYFDNGDYTDDPDWSGYNVANTLHTLSTIFVAQ